jgi:hypothetical protein
MMSVTPDTLRRLHTLRVQLDSTVDAVTADLVRGWARAWDNLVVDWVLAVATLAQLRDDGKWPSRTQIRRAERAQQALAATRSALDELARQAGVTITGQLPAMTEVESQLGLIASQYPGEAGSLEEIMSRFVRADAQQLAAIVRRTTELVTSLLRPLSAEATAELNAALIRGVALGTNPRVAAGKLIRRLEGAFNGGLTRAMVICRTEMLDANRAAAALTHQANADVLAGWQWLAQMDTRTCPSCWSQSGEIHPLSEPGPLDHQQGRCARLPLSKSWKDLGFDIEEPASLVPDARSVFDGLSAADRLAIMGPERLALLDAGAIDWADLSSLRRTSGWRDSYGVRPVKVLRRSTAA